jgi:hypothetical protein
MKILIACEFSGIVREAFVKKGHYVISCDLLESEIPGMHYQGDIFDIINHKWDMMIAHPPCRFLANSGVRWLEKGKNKARMKEMRKAAVFYNMIRSANIKKKCIENPIMHKYAKEIITSIDRQIVQPHWFGEPFFKATGFELYGLPELKPTNKLEVPEKGTEEYKKWSKVHREPPGPDRWKNRSRTFQGVANAMADQWG